MIIKVIEGHKEQTEREYKEKRKRKADLYFKAFSRKVVTENYNDLLSAVFCGVKYVNFYDLTPETTYNELRVFFEFICMLKNIMRYIPVEDLIIQFPIIKNYDGEKFECKDYFSTIDYLKTIDIKDCLRENLDDFLWNYYNQDLMNLSIKELLVLDKLRKMEGKLGIMEEWADMMGIDTYTIHEDEGYIYNRRTMKTMPLRKAIPKWLKIIDNTKKDN